SAALMPRARLVPVGPQQPIAPVAAGVAVLLSLLAAALLVVNGPVSGLVHVGALPLSAGPFALSLRLDAVTVVMLLLVNSIGLVILRFSRRYLDGEPMQARYFRSFLAVSSINNQTTAKTRFKIVFSICEKKKMDQLAG
ncbi:MAG: hypothetical protein EAZ74_07095, partial [Alphaproteobacteria bacterium]